MSKKSRGRRGNISTANRRLPRHLSPSRSISVPLSTFEDRRTFHPLGVTAPARSFSRTNHRLVVPHVVPVYQTRSVRSRSTRGSLVSARIAFAAPEKVLTCVRRQQRKEVLMALKKTGKVGQRPPRGSYYSSISCN